MSKRGLAATAAAGVAAFGAAKAMPDAQPVHPNMSPGQAEAIHNHNNASESTASLKKGAEVAPGNERSAVQTYHEKLNNQEPMHIIQGSYYLEGPNGPLILTHPSLVDVKTENNQITKVVLGGQIPGEGLVTFTVGPESYDIRRLDPNQPHGVSPEPDSFQSIIQDIVDHETHEPIPIDSANLDTKWPQVTATLALKNPQTGALENTPQVPVGLVTEWHEQS